jgi:preprotein translocase subunit SecG
MFTLVTIVHVLVCIGLILIVLLQTGKGADVGAVFGGSSATLFGSSGAGNFLTRLTTIMAIVFMITSILLGYFSGKKPSASVFDAARPRAEQPARPTDQGQAAPAMPSQPTAPQLPAPGPQKAEGGTGSKK